jgi:peptidyl-dipeptidase Dcp
MVVGNSVDPGQAYRSFRGADPKIDGLLRARGFAPQPKQVQAKQVQAE